MLVNFEMLCLARENGTSYNSEVEFIWLCGFGLCSLLMRTNFGGRNFQLGTNYEYHSVAFQRSVIVIVARP